MKLQNNLQLKILTFVLIFMMAFSSALPVLAFYNDQEDSTGNNFTAGNVDFELTNEDFADYETSINLGMGDEVEKTILLDPKTSNPFKYKVEGVDYAGDMDFCAGLTAGLSLGAEEEYSGSLAEIETEEIFDIGNWDLSVSMPEYFANSICEFTTRFTGSQTRHDLPLGSGFNDTEEVRHRVESWGLRINKVYYDVAPDKVRAPDNICMPEPAPYWDINYGCSEGEGESAWTAEVNAKSAEYHGVFSGISGADICYYLHAGNAPEPSGDDPERLFTAKRNALVLLLNIVTEKFDEEAIVSYSGGGSAAYSYFNLTLNSTVADAMLGIESAIANFDPVTSTPLMYAKQVSQYLIDYYINSNDEAPLCLYGPGYMNSSENEGDNEWVEIYNQTNAPLDISGWQICDNTSCDTIPTSDPIPAEGYAVITPSETTWNFWEMPSDMVKIVLGSLIGNGLSNSADMLILKRPDGVILDQMNWGTPDEGWANWNASVWNPGAPDVPEGHMLGRKPSGHDTNQASDFVDLALPSVFLLNPDQDEAGLVWNWEETYTIEWSATNPNGPDSDIRINVYYINDIDGSGTITPGDEQVPIGLNLENTGSTTWTIPGGAGGFLGYVWIKVVAIGPENPMLNARVFSQKIWDPPVEPIEEIAETLMDILTIEDQANNEEVLMSEIPEEEVIVEEILPVYDMDETVPAPENTDEEQLEDSEPEVTADETTPSLEATAGEEEIIESEENDESVVTNGGTSSAIETEEEPANTEEVDANEENQESEPTQEEVATETESEEPVITEETEIEIIENASSENQETLPALEATEDNKQEAPDPVETTEPVIEQPANEPAIEPEIVTEEAVVANNENSNE